MFATVCYVHWLQQAEQEYVAKVEAALEASVVDEDQLIEERRRRRQEILAKHQQDQAPQPGATDEQHCCSCQPIVQGSLSHIQISLSMCKQIQQGRNVYACCYTYSNVVSPTCSVSQDNNTGWLRATST